MTKILTTIDRIRNKAIFNKCWTVVKHMTVDEFHNAIRKYDEELIKHYAFNQWTGNHCLVDYKFALANLLLDHENISVTRYKRLFA